MFLFWCMFCRGINEKVQAQIADTWGSSYLIGNW